MKLTARSRLETYASASRTQSDEATYGLRMEPSALDSGDSVGAGGDGAGRPDVADVEHAARQRRMAMSEQTYAAQSSGEIETPMQMRAEIFRHEYDHPIIRQVMTVADVNGHSAEDRYTMLAFWLLKDNITMRERLMEYAKYEPPKLVPHGPVPERTMRKFYGPSK